MHCFGKKLRSVSCGQHPSQGDADQVEISKVAMVQIYFDIVRSYIPDYTMYELNKNNFPNA